MWQIFIGSLALSAIHGFIPNHWISLIAISKSEKWRTRETLFATFFSGISHMASTMLLGVIVGFAGFKLSQGYEFIAEIAAPATLILIGIVYILIDLRAKNHYHFEHHEKRITGTVLILLGIIAYYAEFKSNIIRGNDYISRLNIK